MPSIHNAIQLFNTLYKKLFHTEYLNGEYFLRGIFLNLSHRRSDRLGKCIFVTF